MDPLVARGFVTLLLTPTRIAQVKEIENTFPAGRYWQAFEVLRYYSLEGGEIPDEREAKMKYLLEAWEKINWKQNQMEDKNHVEKCGQAVLGKCKCRTRQQEIHDWMDYVNKHWIEPLPVAGKGKSSDKFGAGTYQKRGNRKSSPPDTTDGSGEPEQSDLGVLS